MAEPSRIAAELQYAHSPIIFWVRDGAKQTEILRFELNGDCYVRGEKVDRNPEVYRALREWMGQSGIMKDTP